MYGILVSQIGAWVSDQSELVGSREELDKKAKDIEVIIPE